MKKIKFILLAALCVSCLSGCWYEDFEEEIKHIYKVDSLRLNVDQRPFIKIIPMLLRIGYLILRADSFILRPTPVCLSKDVAM